MRQLGRDMSEHREQTKLFEELKKLAATYPVVELAFSIPNAAKRSFSVACYMKREGLKSGVPDLFLPVARNGYHGLFIEMKSKLGKLTEQQCAWLFALQKQGYLAIVCRSANEALRNILAYLEIGD